MNKVYVVTSGEYSDYMIDHVTLDKKKAYDFVDFHNLEGRHYEVEEYELDDFSLKHSYVFCGVKDDGTNYYFTSIVDNPEDEANRRLSRKLYGDYKGTISVGYGKTKEQAFKSAKDRYYKKLAEQEGIA